MIFNDGSARRLGDEVERSGGHGRHRLSRATRRARCGTIRGRRYDRPDDRVPPTLTLILYEYPFNESIRTMLRLEHLFDRLGQLIARDAPVDHHYALATLFEIMDVASRADLKSDLLKELDKQRQQLNSYRGNPSISEARSTKCSAASTTRSMA